MEYWWNDADIVQPTYSESVLIPHCPPQIPHELGLGLNPGLLTEKPRRIKCLIFVLFYVFFVFYVFLCCSMYCLFFDVLCIVCVYMCTVLLPPGGYPIAVNKCIISYNDAMLNNRKL